MEWRVHVAAAQRTRRSACCPVCGHREAREHVAREDSHYTGPARWEALEPAPPGVVDLEAEGAVTLNARAGACTAGALAAVVDHKAQEGWVRVREQPHLLVAALAYCWRWRRAL